MADTTPFTLLTAVGRLRRLGKLAHTALQAYPLADPLIHYHSSHTNIFYRVTHAAGEPLMLRLARPSWRSLQDLTSEALWLQALARDTDIPVPRILPTCTGELVLPFSLSGAAEAWHVTMMSWVPGRLLGHYLTQANLEKMGELFARLHIHGAAFVPPSGFTTRRFEHWLSRGEPNLILGGAAEGLGISAAQRTLLERIDRLVEQVYRSLDRTDLRVIHCDLWHDNIKLHAGKLYPFDFEDTVWGFPAHDLAMSMLDLLETVGAAAYSACLAAVKRGYNRLLPWPVDPLEPFQIGRLLWKINWVAGHQPQWLSNMVEENTPVFEAFERTGQVF